MASRLKAGGRLFINTRKAGEEKGIKDKIELDSPQEVLVKRNGKIASYQRFFTPQELKEYVEKELGEGYKVEIANEENSGTKGLAAVVVTKESQGESTGAKAASSSVQRMTSAVNDLAQKLHLNNVEIVTEPITVRDKNGKVHRPKGYFNPKTGKITISIANNADVDDAVSTLLHEAVAHYGLRKLLGENFDTFLDNVFANVNDNIRKKIEDAAKKRYDGDTRTATEEYLASLAEKENFEEARKQGVWDKIKDLFFELLHKVGVKLKRKLTDNDLRYMLWRSYENLKEGKGGRTMLQEAADAAKRDELGIRNEAAETASQAEENREVGEKSRLWGKHDMVSLAKRTAEGEDPQLLFRDSVDPDDDTARAVYDKKAEAIGTRLREAWQDSMINVKNLQDAVLEQRGEKIEDWENAYMQENNLHGVSKAEAEYYQTNMFAPLIKALNNLAKAAGMNLADVYDYMIAKHGLERNEYMAKRYAEEWKKKQEAAGKQVTDMELNSEYQTLRQKDYAGLTGLKGMDKVSDAEAEARRMVDELEKKAGADAVQNLWERVKAANKWTLRKAYESGDIDKATYEKIRDMYDYYIPLRGWGEATSEDIYDYINAGAGDGYSAPIKEAKGRTTKADNPIANIGNMAMTAIVAGNHNRMKQALLWFARNHPSSLISISEMWYVNKGTKDDPIWVEASPDIPEGATADEIDAIMKDFNDKMKDLKSQGMATMERGGLHLGMITKPGEADEHKVKVRVNGKTYVMYINGNPRAAQAMNGTRVRSASESTRESGWIARFSNWLGRSYTSLNPSFTVSNAMRDLTMANAVSFIKEGPMYALKFRKNVLKLTGRNVTKGGVFMLMHKYNGGKLDLNNETERYFYEFMTRGAETGYTSIYSSDEMKKNINRMLKSAERSALDPREAWKASLDGIETLNRCIEDATRFATYMTSRQSGRSIDQSVSDAKNITLNFNRKGTGEMGNATFRHLFVFINPAIQSLQLIASLATKHPIRFGIYAGFVASVGMASAMLPMLMLELMKSIAGDDDELLKKLLGGDANWNPVEEYFKLPEWQRRNNLCLWVPGTHKFAMIPLSQEFRVIHGFGEMMSSVYMGREEGTAKDIALNVMSQASDLLPINVTGNSGNVIIDFAPTVLQPLLQVAFNTDYSGRPIYKDSEWNKYEPEFQKAYVGTPSMFISSSKMINELSGGNDHKKGSVERSKVGNVVNNPAVVNHIAKGYLGGPYTFLSSLGGAGWKVLHGETPDAQEIPVVNRVITEPRETDKSGKKRMPDWYFETKDDADRVMNEWNNYLKDAQGGDATAKERIREMGSDGEYRRAYQLQQLSRAANDIRRAMKLRRDAASQGQMQRRLNTVLNKMDSVRRHG
jgi:uncharacterized protein YjaZ